MKKNNSLSSSLPDKIFGLERSLLVLFVPLLILVVLILISLNLVLVPKIKEISEIKDKAIEMKANTNKIDEQNKYLVSVNKDKLKKDGEYLDSAVLKDKKSYLLVGIIRGIANQFNYQIESFSLTPGKLKDDESIKINNSDQVTKMPISLLMFGPKDKSLDLILALEKTLPILFIDKFETKTTGDLTELNLIVSSYYVGDKSKVDTNSVTLSELRLSDDEEELIKRVSNFSKTEDNQSGTGSAEFQQYQRENPFSL